MLVGLTRLLRRGVRGVVVRVRAAGRFCYRVATDRTLRPVLGYLLSMGLGITSVLVFLVSGAGRPRTPETVLLLSALAAIILTLFGLGGSRPHRE